jgi:transcriptional regulator with XRE-family HTH domain
MSFAKRFGQNLARERRAAGLSQELLAEMASLHRTAVGQLERGERVARTDTLARLCGALGIDAGVLLEGLVWVAPKIDTGHFEFPAASEQKVPADRDSSIR